ncbi:MAG: hypothetical protein JST16_05245 [Bdellovibrionales bacterium]|nr:hypothetical protein [Bdellovibrionales bacterium]
MTTLSALFQNHLPVNGACLGAPDPKETKLFWFLCFLTAALGYLVFFSPLAHAGPATLPGEDASDKLQAAGTLLRMIDTALFKWGARLFSGLCIMSAGWALKEQRFGIAVICVIGAILFGTAPIWVKNIFEIGGNQGLFSQVLFELTSPSGATAYA